MIPEIHITALSDVLSYHLADNLTINWIKLHKELGLGG